MQVKFRPVSTSQFRPSKLEIPRGEGEAGTVVAAEGAAAAGGAAFVKQFGLLQSHTSVTPKVNFGVDWVTGAVEDNASAGDVGGFYILHRRRCPPAVIGSV